MPNTNQRKLKALGLAFWLTFSLVAWGQPQSPLGYSVATPRPINPAEGTTTPSAQAAQRQNPYLGSVPSKNTGTRIELSLRTAIERGLRYNLGWSKPTRRARTYAPNGFVHSPRYCRNWQLRDARVTKTSVTKRLALSCRRSLVCPRCPPRAADLD